MKYQSDYPLVFDNALYRDGCLVCILAGEIEAYLGLELSDQVFLDLIRDCFTAYRGADGKTPVMSDERDKGKMGCFLRDHEMFGTLVCRRLGTPRRIRYLGCSVMPWWETEQFRSWGTRKDADIILWQIRTPNGGHFRSANRDPWKDGTTMNDLRSLRWYKMI